MLKFTTSSLLALSVMCAFPIAASAQTIANPSFESRMDGWTENDGTGKAVTISGESSSGSSSLKITDKSGNVQQVVTLTPNQNYRLSVMVRGAGLVGVKVDGKVFFERGRKSKKWKALSVEFNSGNAQAGVIFLGHNGADGRYDDITLEPVSSLEQTSISVVPKSAGGTGLSPDLPPGQNFDLASWYLSVPSDENRDGKSDTINELQLVKGYEDKRFFYTADDGGMVFRCPVQGAKTSANTSFTRVELREMLRRGDKSISTKGPGKNNWVFSTAPDRVKRSAGGVDGRLEATLAVNHVTTTGKASEVGRVIIGQIHAKDDEPIRLYYRKLPHHQNGTIYAAHEVKGQKDDVYYPIIGDRRNSAPDPAGGIPLNAKFSYIIDAKGDILNVAIRRDGQDIATETMDMSASGYATDDEYMYFKAGVYNQNKTGEPDDYVQATFYALRNSHD